MEKKDYSKTHFSSHLFKTDRGKHRCSHDSVDHQRAFAGSLSGSKRNSDTPSLRIVSNSQNFILGAVIHNKDCAPYQHEMIDNYLVDARQRFDLDNEMKAKQKLVTNSPDVFTNLEFRSYDFILRIFVMISFLTGKLRRKKTVLDR